MDLIEQLESLRISESSFFGVDYKTACAFNRANSMLDDCLDIIYKWLYEEGYIH